MLPNFKATGMFTQKWNTTTSDVASIQTTPRSSATKAKKRGKLRLMFAGCVVLSRSTTTQSFTITITINNDIASTKFYLDIAPIDPGNSLVWNERDYGVTLDDDEYVKVQVLPSDGGAYFGGDHLSVFIHTKDLL